MGLTLYLDAKKRRKSSWKSDGVYGDRFYGYWSVGREKFDKGDPNEDEGRSAQRPAAKMFM